MTCAWKVLLVMWKDGNVKKVAREDNDLKGSKARQTHDHNPRRRNITSPFYHAVHYGFGMPVHVPIFILSLCLGTLMDLWDIL